MQSSNNFTCFEAITTYWICHRGINGGQFSSLVSSQCTCALQTILNMEIDSVLSPYCTPSTYSDVLASVTPPKITLPADAVLPPPVKSLPLQSSSVALSICSCLQG